MKDRLPTFIAIALLICLVVGTWWAADYAQRSVWVDPPRRITHEPDSWADKFVMLRTDENGMPINRIEGDRMLHYPDDDSYEVMQARATGQRPGSPTTVATSNTAVMDRDGARIVMQGDAHVHRPPYEDRPALDVRSEQLIILPDEDLVHTDLPAQVVNGRSTMNGTGMRYDNKTRQLQVFSTTDVKIAGEDAKRPEKQNDSITIEP
ncbi:MAG: LPS export ABC transporter periplasmic protein LptC [Candidimonas sp.]